VAVQYVSAGTAASGAAAITVALPATRQTDDLLLLLVETANQAVTTPSGWTEAPSSPQGTGTAAGTAATRLSLFYRWVDGTETNASVADSGDHQTAQIICYRGVDLSNPFNASAGSVKDTASTAVTFPSVTTTVDNCRVLLIEAHALPDSNSTAIVSGHTNANLTDIIEQLDQNTNAGNGGGFSLADGAMETAGATGTSSATLTTSSVGAHITLALQPFVELQQLTLTADPAAVDAVGSDAGISRQFPPLPAEASAVALSGTDALLFKGMTLAVDAASFQIDQFDATTTATRRLVAAASSFGVAERTAGLVAARTLVAAQAQFDLQAPDTGLEKHYKLSAEAAAYAVSGLDALVGKSYGLSAAPGAFAAGFQDAELVPDLNEPPQMPEVNGAELLWYEILGEPIPSRDIQADQGAFDAALVAAKVLYGRTVTAAAGSFSAAANTNAFRRTYSLKADLAAFTQAGADSLLKTARKLVADTDSFSHAGQPAGVLYGRVVSAEARTHAFAGVAMNFKFQRFLRAVLAGVDAVVLDATLFKSLNFSAAGAVFSTNAYFEPGYIDGAYFTGEAKLLRQYPVQANVGGFALGSSQTTFRKTKLFIADAGGFALAGTNTGVRTNRRMLAATVGYAHQPYDIGFSWQHVMRPFPEAFDVARIDAAIKKIITLYADGAAYTLEGYSSRPFFSSLPRAEDYVMRPLELRGTLRPVELRQTVRPQEMTTAVRPQDLRGAIRPAEDRTSERGEESRYAEHE
jgi:hypothetical protein